jgi:hypothetical protein
MKPRVMSLVVFTALVGLLVAPGRINLLIGFVALPARDNFLREAKALRETLAEALAEVRRMRRIMELGDVERTTETLN